jgi:Flp pilus assembly protein TadG
MTRTDRIFLRFCRSVRGATALEFAILSPVFIMIVVGGVNLGLLLFSVGSLHYAVEAAARCASVKTAVCADASTIQSYARSAYFGPTISPTFTYSTASCGNLVSASATFVLDAGMLRYSVPLSASACFPKFV